MNPIKLIDRMRGILGRDCNGKALRVGDLVEPALPPEQVRDEAHGILKILGVEPDQERYPGRLEVLCPGGRKMCGKPSELRKIDNPDNESWDAITKSTGWTPKVVKVKDPAHALDT